MDVEEPMDVDTEEIGKFDELLEEGEYVESNRVSRKALPSVVSVPVTRYDNKAGTFVTGVDIFSKEAKEKMEERAKRFGIPKEEIKSTLNEVDSLYDSFGIVEHSQNAKNYRLNVIHMRGTENMKTKDIFKYFEEYPPASLEWINDISCNVVWLDETSAARAILGKSKKIIGIRNKAIHNADSDNESKDSLEGETMAQAHDENAIHASEIRCPLPPGIWRKGQPYMDSKNIFLRFATRSDKKQPHAEKMSEYYRKHGNPNYGGLKGVISSSRKRASKEFREISPPVKVESNTNGVKVAAKNPWGSLSKNWGVTDFVEDDYLPQAPPEPVSNVKQRLGFKPVEREEETEEEIEEENTNIIELSDEQSGSENSSEEEHWCRRNKMPRMRMHADDEEEKIQKRKGKIRELVHKFGDDKSHQQANIRPGDLRGRLTAKRRLPRVNQEAIQVIVKNPQAIHNDNLSEDEDEDDVQELVIQPEEDNEEEEGEIVDDSETDSKVEYEDEEEENANESKLPSESEESDSSVSEKEVQGPKGSVIKVVQRKPKLASTVSTVWSRLNNTRTERSDNTSQDRQHSNMDLRYTLNKTDLRSRIGNHNMSGRSPIRIDRSDKYLSRRSDSD